MGSQFEYLILLFFFNIFLLNSYSQNIDVDSLYMVDENFQHFIEDLNVNMLEDIPAWDIVYIYKKLGWKDLSMRMYKGKTLKKEKPTIVFFHGGGWINRAINQHKQYAYYFANKGFNTISVEYRVFNDSSIVTPYDELEDVKSAFRFLRLNADDLEIDTSKIIGCGMTAGGHLVSAAAFIQDYESDSENMNVSSSPNVLILQNPVFDLSEDGWEYGHDLIGDQWRLFSPLHNINNCESIPSIVLSGTDDPVAPFVGMLRWDSIYSGKGCDNHLYSFNGRGHGFSNYSESKSGEGHRDFFYSIYLIQSFLDRQGLSANDSFLKSETNYLKLYPNPVEDVLRFPGIFSVIKIYNVTGNLELVLFNASEIMVDELTKGLKFIEFHDVNDVCFVGKVVVK